MIGASPVNHTRGSTMKITLCSCPATDPALPPASLPALGAHIEKTTGHLPILRDLNIDCFNYLFGEDDTISNIGMGGSDAYRVVDVLRKKEQYYDPVKFVAMRAYFKDLYSGHSRGCEDVEFDRFSIWKTSIKSAENVVEIIDSIAPDFLGGFWDNVAIPSLIADRAQLIGISVVYESQFISSFYLASRIREACPDAFIIMGGPVISWSIDWIMKNSRLREIADGYCIGVGELCIEHVVGMLEGRVKKHQVPGLVYFNGISVVKNGSADIQMDGLARPIYEKLSLKKYHAPDRLITLVMNRGCYWKKCDFCNYSFIRNGRYEERSVQHVVDDMARIKRETGETVFCLESDVSSTSYLRRLSESIIDSGLSCKWGATARFEPGFDYGLLKLMADAGCIRMYFGLESGSQRLLDMMKKGIRLNVVQSILDDCKKVDIAIEIGIIVGFPGETEAEVLETVKFIEKNRNKIHRPDVSVFRYLDRAPIMANGEDVGQNGTSNGSAMTWYSSTCLDEMERNDIEFKKRMKKRIEDLFPDFEYKSVCEDYLFIAERN